MLQIGEYKYNCKTKIIYKNMTLQPILSYPILANSWALIVYGKNDISIAYSRLGCFHGLLHMLWLKCDSIYDIS